MVRAGRPPRGVSSMAPTWWRNDRRFTPHPEGSLDGGLGAVGVAASRGGDGRTVHGRAHGLLGEYPSEHLGGQADDQVVEHGALGHARDDRARGRLPVDLCGCGVIVEILI